VPIHLRAQPGEYAEACLLPGDPLRARFIAKQFLENVVERNSERALYGYTGEFEGNPVSVQATGMGGPSTAIVVEELAQLGVKRLLRVGTCGGLQPDLAFGELIVALTAIPQDRTSWTYVSEPHCPTADWELVHGLVHAAKELGERPRVGPIVSSDVFYNPDRDQYRRWAELGVLAVEMEASALFTLGALRKLETGCLLTVSDLLADGESRRIGDDDLRAAVERMTLLALRTVTADRKH
jgi:DeoD family purine-nucleoside phosphorylase